MCLNDHFFRMTPCHQRPVWVSLYVDHFLITSTSTLTITFFVALFSGPKGGCRAQVCLYLFGTPALISLWQFILLQVTVKAVYCDRWYFYCTVNLMKLAQIDQVPNNFLKSTFCNKDLCWLLSPHFVVVIISLCPKVITLKISNVFQYFLPKIYYSQMKQYFITKPLISDRVKLETSNN